MERQLSPVTTFGPNAKLRALVVPQKLEPPEQATPPAECETICAHHRPVRLSWAKLLKRVSISTWTIARTAAAS